MTHPSKMEIPELETRRKMAVQRSTFGDVEMIYTDPETRAGVVLAKSRMRHGGRFYAYFFRPAQINRYFSEQEVKTAHEKINAVKILKDKLNFEKAEKKAGHDFKVGDILASIWGHSMQDVNFYQVVNIPHHQKVELAPIPGQMHSGDWMSGTKIPMVPADGKLVSDRGEVYKTIVKNGKSSVNMRSSITFCRKWDGKPVSTYCD